MVKLAYNLSPSLRECLQKIEALRQQILLTPISPKIELRLRWEAMLGRLYWSLSLINNSLNKSQMIKLLIAQNRKKLSREEQEVIKYKKALDYISQEWLVSARLVTPKVILNLHELACFGELKISEAEAEKNLKQFLDYLQIGQENPVIQAAVAQAEIITLSPFADGNGRIARLLALIFLYKYGYDFRGLLQLEEYWRRDLVGLKNATTSIVGSGNLTGWLEYFANTFYSTVERIKENINSSRFQTELPASFWELNDRQKEILSLFAEPETNITNRKVQKQFRVSQITASRDLSKLANLGLVFPRGKGRSIYYTRV